MTFEEKTSILKIGRGNEISNVFLLEDEKYKYLEELHEFVPVEQQRCFSSMLLIAHSREVADLTFEREVRILGKALVTKYSQLTKFTNTNYNYYASTLSPEISSIVSYIEGVIAAVRHFATLFDIKEQYVWNYPHAKSFIGFPLSEFIWFCHRISSSNTLLDYEDFVLTADSLGVRTGADALQKVTTLDSQIFDF